MAIILIIPFRSAHIEFLPSPHARSPHPQCIRIAHAPSGEGCPRSESVQRVHIPTAKREGHRSVQPTRHCHRPLYSTTRSTVLLPPPSPPISPPSPAWAHPRPASARGPTPSSPSPPCPSRPPRRPVRLRRRRRPAPPHRSRSAGSRRTCGGREGRWGAPKEMRWYVMVCEALAAPVVGLAQHGARGEQLAEEHLDRRGRRQACAAHGAPGQQCTAWKGARCGSAPCVGSAAGRAPRAQRR